jgi:murein DD-endopeptidase MepM/ murein hydrolase activator NlpD
VDPGYTGSASAKYSGVKAYLSQGSSGPADYTLGDLERVTVLGVNGAWAKIAEKPCSYIPGTSTPVFCGPLYVEANKLWPVNLFKWPVPSSSRITSGYGMRLDPVDKKTWKWHPGIDIGAPCGSSIVAAQAGQVVTGYQADGAGHYVKIIHERDGNGNPLLETKYFHAQAGSLTTATRVSKGAVIARVGTSGRSTGCHLHFEAHKSGTDKDPAHFTVYP